MNQFIKILLLIVMSFSIVHGLVMEHEGHCDMSEYVEEFSKSISHDKLHEHESEACESHYMYHISFLLPEIFSLYEIKQEAFVLPLLSSKNHFLYQKNTFRPPIA